MDIQQAKLEEGLFDYPDWYYRRLPALNITYAKLFNQSPKHVYTAIYDPAAQIVSPTYAMNEGTGFHWLALEPKKFENQVVADLEINHNKNEYKEWVAENSGKLILKAESIRNIRTMVDVLKSKQTPQKYISEGWAEKSIIWFEDDFNIWCKGRIDWIRKDGQVLADLKKTKNASSYAFSWTIKKYDYYVQAAHYIRGYSKIMGYRPQQWAWIASEIDPPNECNVFIADPAEVEDAEIRLMSWYQRFSECEKTGQWPGYADQEIYLGAEPVDEYEDIETEDIGF